MKLSIITPCLNVGWCIEHLLRSLHAQVGVNYEHIIIDGASTDNTLDVIAQHGGCSILISEEDRNLYDAMNKGLALATGDVIQIMNADDAYNGPFAIKTMLAALESQGADYVYSGALVVNSDRDVLKPVNEDMMPMHHNTVFARRICYDRHGYYPTDIGISADVPWMIKVKEDAELKGYRVSGRCIYFYHGGLSNQAVDGSQ